MTESRWSREEVADAIGDALIRPEGELIIRYGAGEIRVSIDAQMWTELDDRARSFFAERLAAISEDGAAILACVDGDLSDLEPSSYREVRIHPKERA